MKRIKALLIIVMLVTCLFTACAGKGEQQGSEVVQSGAVDEGHSDFEWKTGDWNCNLENASAYLVYPERFVHALDCDVPGEHTNMYADRGSDIYSVSTYSQSTEDGYVFRYYLNTYHTDSGEKESREFELPVIEGYEDMKPVLSAFDMICEKEMVLFVQARIENVNQAYLAVHMDSDGKVLSVTDLQPILKENDVELREDYIFNNICADSQGMYHAYNHTNCLVINKEGELVCCLGQNRGDGECSFGFKTPDGMVVSLWDSDRIEEDCLLTFDKDKGELVLAKGEIPAWSGMALADEGYVYYLSEDAQLYRWDLISGANQLCANMKGEGIITSKAQIRMVLKSTGEPVVVATEGIKSRVHATSFTPVERNVEEIRIWDLLNYGSFREGESFAASSAVRFAQECSDCKLQIETADVKGKSLAERDQAMDAFRTQKLNELIAGDIPDIFFLTKEDFLMLGEKGMFADLTDILSPETMSHVFANSQQGGVIDGKQYAVIPEATAKLVFVDKDVWDKDVWTLEEALDLMDRHPRYQYLLNTLYADRGLGVLYDIYLYDLDNTPFLDLKNGTCDFTNPLFLRLIQKFKGITYYFKSWESEDTPYDECAGFVDEIGGYSFFTLTMNRYERKYKVMGIPAENGSGMYWLPSGGFVVVSKEAQDKRAVKDFLEYLFSVENQRYSSFQVRNDLLDQYVQNVDEPWMQGWKYKSAGGWFDFAWKSDGSSYAQDYVECMEACMYPNGDTEDIMNIVREELSGYFESDRSAEQAAQAIQKRVQLYLDEKQ